MRVARPRQFTVFSIPAVSHQGESTLRNRTLRMLIPLVLGLLTSLLVGCATRLQGHVSDPPTVSCLAPLQPYLRTTLYTDRSNRNDPSGRMSDDEWQRFVDEILVRHFPVGGTMYSNTGWWRRPDGSTGGGTGRTIVLLVSISELQAHRSSVRAVIDEIKRRFGHQSVGWEEEWVCVSF